MKQPDYDFFVRPGGGADGGQGGAPDPRFGSSSAAPAAAPFGAPAAGGTDQYGNPAGGSVNQFGTPVGQFGAPAPGQWAPGQLAPGQLAPGQFQHSPPGAAPRRGLPGWAIALIVLGGLVACGIVAAVAVPVFLNQRGSGAYQATTMQLPASVEGLPRNAADAHGETLATGLQSKLDQSMPGVFLFQGASYGDAAAGHVAYVVLGHATRPLTAVERAGIRVGLNQSSAKLENQPAGSLGGDFQCLKSGTTATSCVSTDPAGIVVIAVGGGDQSGQVDQARRIRETVEHRTS